MIPFQTLAQCPVQTDAQYISTALPSWPHLHACAQVGVDAIAQTWPRWPCVTHFAGSELGVASHSALNLPPMLLEKGGLLGAAHKYLPVSWNSSQETDPSSEPQNLPEKVPELRPLGYT